MCRNRAKVSPLAEEATFYCSVDILCRGPLGLIYGQGVRELMLVSRATVATKELIVCAVLACDSHTKAPNAYTTLLTLEHSVKLFCPASNASFSYGLYFARLIVQHMLQPAFDLSGQSRRR